MGKSAEPASTEFATGKQGRKINRVQGGMRVFGCLGIDSEGNRAEPKLAAIAESDNLHSI